jgi:hypothetical protein
MIIDQITAQLQNLNRDLKALPAALDAISACKEHGVVMPPNSVWASLDDLDLSLDRAFGVLDLNSLAGKRQWEARVALKSQILASGMVAPPEKKLDERAVTYACNLLRKHGVKLRLTTKCS